MADRNQNHETYDNHGEIILTGSSNAYVATVARQLNGYFQGLRICAKANHTNDGASTLNIITQSAPSGIGAVAIRKGASTALSGGEILDGKYYDFIYDAANSVFQIMETPAPASVGTTEIADGAVTYAKIQNVSATSRILGRATAGAGPVEELTLTQVLDFIGSAAEGDLLYRGASSWARLAATTDGNVLTLASGVPSWQNNAGGIGLLTSGTVSAAATLDLVLTSYTGYRALKILLNSFRPATDGAKLWLRTSTNGGSTFSAGASDYAYAIYYDIPDVAAASEGDQSTSQIVLTEDVGNVAAEACQVEIMLYDLTNAAVFTKARFDSMCRRTDGTFALTRGAGQRNAAEDVDAIRLLFSSGNITSGSYAVYGLA